jgi:hypothetical protein
VLIGLDFIPQIKSNSDNEVLLFSTMIFLIPLYMSVSIIRKNEGDLALIYKYIFISQLAFVFLQIAQTLTKSNLFFSLSFVLLFFSFAIVFDLRLSMFLSEQKEKSAEPANDGLLEAKQ